MTESFCSVKNDRESLSHSDTGSSSSASICANTIGNIAKAELSASANYGDLQMSLLALVGAGDDPGFQDSAFVKGSASYSDELTILGVGTGFIRVLLTHMMFSIDAFGTADFTLGSYNAPTFNVNHIDDGLPVTVPIVFGRATPIAARLEGIGAGDNSGFAALDNYQFSQFFEVLDASGNKLTDYKYTSGSNGDYAFDGGIRIAVPEPGNCLTFLLGLSMTALTRRRNL